MQSCSAGISGMTHGYRTVEYQGSDNTAFNLSLIIRQVTIIGFLACAQTLIVLTADIDLSIAAIMLLASVVAGKFAVVLEVPSFLAIPCGFVIGTLGGLVNGLLVTRLRLPPFIVTGIVVCPSCLSRTTCLMCSR